LHSECIKISSEWGRGSEYDFATFGVSFIV
jgi:hypothetical protein